MLKVLLFTFMIISLMWFLLIAIDNSRKDGDEQ